jgi:peptide/nickel transport system substrate-binding protein
VVEAVRIPGSRRLVALLACVALLGAACGGGGDDNQAGGSGESVAPQDIPKGGTLKIAGTSDVDFMDYGAAYYTVSTFLARGAFRQLVTYPPAQDVQDQRELVPDLATDTGQANGDLTEWTYTLKDGIKFGPALGGENVPGVTGEEITSDDIRYAIERLFNPSVGAGYPFYYEVIEGAQKFADGKADSISGIETPDDKTIIFHLSEPVGDWPMRLSMPAISPTPRKYVEQFDKKNDSDYDSHVVSSGPYYISEWQPEEQISLERNEYWDPQTDEVRHAYVDSVDWKLGFDNDVGVRKVLDGEYQLGLDVSPQGPALEQVVNDPDLQDNYIDDITSCTRYIYMNTTVEPFDDPTVREAVEYAIDRSNIKRIFGGPVTGPIATSVIPETFPGGLSADEFNPFETPNMAGDMDHAKELMADAGFPNGYDGEVLVVGASDPPHDRIAEAVRQDLENLGFSNLTIKTPAYPNQYTQFYQIPSKDVGIGTSAGWCSDYPDSSTFIEPLFNGDNINPASNQNYSEIDDPQINGQIDDALKLPLGADRAAAWEQLNRELTEQALWIPWSWDSANVIHSDDLVNPIYMDFFAHVDWVNAGVAQ